MSDFSQSNITKMQQTYTRLEHERAEYLKRSQNTNYKPDQREMYAGKVVAIDAYLERIRRIYTVDSYNVNQDAVADLARRTQVFALQLLESEAEATPATMARVAVEAIRLVRKSELEQEARAKTANRRAAEADCKRLEIEYETKRRRLETLSNELTTAAQRVKEVEAGLIDGTATAAAVVQAKAEYQALSEAVPKVRRDVDLVGLYFEEIKVYLRCDEENHAEAERRIDHEIAAIELATATERHKKAEHELWTYQSNTRSAKSRLERVREMIVTEELRRNPGAVDRDILQRFRKGWN